MNREIKFRGKRLDNGEWVFGNLLQICGGYIIYHGSQTESDEFEDDGKTAIYLYKNEVSAVDPSTVGQFTGLLDRNGKEIYEGDIITVIGNYPRVILWDKVSWAIMPCELYNDKHFWVMNLQHPGNDWWEEFANEMNIVGNIDDNPELLKQ